MTLKISHVLLVGYDSTTPVAIIINKVYSSKKEALLMALKLSTTFIKCRKIEHMIVDFEEGVITFELSPF
jgi:hypothetical protein